MIKLHEKSEIENLTEKEYNLTHGINRNDEHETKIKRFGQNKKDRRGRQIMLTKQYEDHEFDFIAALSKGNILTKLPLQNRGVVLCNSAVRY